MRPIVTNGLSVCVCLFGYKRHTYKTDKPIEEPFGIWTRVCPSNHELGWNPDPPGKGQFVGHLKVKCTGNIRRESVIL